VTCQYGDVAEIKNAKKAAKIAKKERVLKARGGESAIINTDSPKNSEVNTKDNAIFWLEKSVSLGHTKAMVIASTFDIL
jgi:hypothetical protein